MEFVGNLCIALGCTLAKVDAMSAAEFAFWKVFRSTYGFPADRIEWAIAISGAAHCRVWGEKVDPKEMLPRFAAAPVSNRLLTARLSSLPGAKVRRIPRPERKAKNERVREAGAEEETGKPRTRLLNPKR